MLGTTVFNFGNEHCYTCTGNVHVSLMGTFIGNIRMHGSHSKGMENRPSIRLQKSPIFNVTHASCIKLNHKKVRYNCFQSW